MADLKGCNNAMLDQDGPSNVLNEPVIITCLQVNVKSYLLHTNSTCIMSTSSNNGKELFQQSIQVTKENSGSKLASTE